MKLLPQHWIKPSGEESANHLIKQHGGNERSKGVHFLQEWEKKEWEEMNEGGGGGGGRGGGGCRWDKLCTYVCVGG